MYRPLVAINSLNRPLLAQVVTHIHSLVRVNGVYSQECELGGCALTGTKAIGSRIGLTLHHYITFCGSRWVVSRHIIPGLTLLSNWALYQVLSVQNNNVNSNITFVQFFRG